MFGYLENHVVIRAGIKPLIRVKIIANLIITPRITTKPHWVPDPGDVLKQSRRHDETLECLSAISVRESCGAGF